MSHRIPVVLASLACACTQAAVAQKHRADAPPVPYAERSFFSVRLDYGGVQSAYLADDLGYFDDGGNYHAADLGGLGLNLRLLLRTRLLAARLKLGGEAGVFTLQAGNLPPGAECYPPGSICAAPDNLGYFINALADLHLFSMGRMVLRAEGAVGVTFYALPGSSDLFPNPGPEPGVSSRLVAGIPVSRSVMLEPTVGLLRTFGDARATSVRVGVGASLLWP